MTLYTYIIKKAVLKNSELGYHKLTRGTTGKKVGYDDSSSVVLKGMVCPLISFSASVNHWF